MILRIVRALIAGILLWAAFSKALIPTEGPTLYQRWLTEWHGFRYLIPCVEGILAISLLLWGGRWSGPSLATIILISAFSGLVLLELTKEYPKPCGCMGVAASAYEPAAIRLALTMDIGRNVLMIAGACCVYLAAKRAPGTNSVK